MRNFFLRLNVSFDGIRKRQRNTGSQKVWSLIDQGPNKVNTLRLIAGTCKSHSSGAISPVFVCLLALFVSSTCVETPSLSFQKAPYFGFVFASLCRPLTTVLSLGDYKNIKTTGRTGENSRGVLWKKRYVPFVFIKLYYYF